MTTPAVFAAKAPDRPAVIYGDGELVESYGELEQRSRQLGHVLRGFGLEPGDCVAALIANDDVFYDLFWACHRTGLYFVPVNWHLQRDEVQYIVDNCDAKALIAHPRFSEVALTVPAAVPKLRVTAAWGGEIPGFRRLEDAVAGIPAEKPLGSELEGSVMLYSSGTTGRPKGVRRPLPRVAAGDPRFNATAVGLVSLFGMREGDVYLSPAPLYHAAPLAFSSAQHRIGATSVIMRRFEPEAALQLIERHRARTSQWVPTHFIRLLRLPSRCVRAMTSRASRWPCMRRHRAPCP